MRGTVTATGALLIIIAVYAVSCWVWPYRDCGRCEGRGNFRPEGNRKLSRPCRRCKGTGKRLRIGRRLWNWWRRLHREGSTA